MHLTFFSQNAQKNWILTGENMKQHAIGFITINTTRMFVFNGNWNLSSVRYRMESQTQWKSN